MEDFKMRTMTKKSKDGSMEVSHSRNSKGYAAISIRVGNESLSFTNEGAMKENAGDYAFEVRELAEMLTEVADEPCELS